MRETPGSNRTHPGWASASWRVLAHPKRQFSKLFLKEETSPASTVPTGCASPRFTADIVRTWFLICNLVISTACWTDFSMSFSQWIWRAINHCAPDYNFSLTRIFFFHILLNIQQKQHLQRHITPLRAPTDPLAPGPDDNQPVSAFSRILTLGLLLPWQTFLTSPHFHWGSTGRNQGRIYPREFLD